MIRGVKTCRQCKRSYSVGDPGPTAALLVYPWQLLKRIGVQIIEVEAFELRDCACRTTLVWPIDLEAAKRPVPEIIYLHVDWEPPCE